MLSRGLDIFLAGLALFIASPFLICVALVLRFTGEGEIFFLQERVGRNNKTFKLYKFVTMIKNSPNMGSGTVTQHNDPRILPVGRFLRKTKINEIPQLFNVIFGDMAIIGPRPQTKRCFDAFPLDAQQVITTVRPGLSGAGSIIFRDEEKMISGSGSTQFYDDVIMPYKGEVEKWYVARRGIVLDIVLMLMTLVAVAIPGAADIQRLFPDLPKPPLALREILRA